MKKIITILQVLNCKRIITQSSLFVLFIASLCNPKITYSQPPNIKAAIESIAKYTNLGTDRTSVLLQEIGFVIPENLKPQWDYFPAVRKIETAFLAAEQGSGERLLALLSSSLAQRYESIRYENALSQYFSNPGTSNTMVFNNITSLETKPLAEGISKQVQQSILALTKYSDARALGGVKGILKYHFNLADDKVYEILRSSENNYDALLRGIQYASIPPSQKERLTSIIKELQSSYEAAKLDVELNKINKSFSPEKMPNGTALENNNKKIPEKYMEYEKYQEKHFSNEKAKSFDKMKKDVNSFGGIVFGNKISTGLTLQNKKLKFVKWISNTTEVDSLNASGILEFEFSDGSVKIVPSISLEDIYAAYTIIYGDSLLQAYKLGEGIGLAGADHLITNMSQEKEYSKRDPKYLKYLNNYYWNSVNDSLQGYEFFSYERCILHPIIANLELGRCLIRCDVWLRTCDSLKRRLFNQRPTEAQKKVVSAWLTGCESNGWKYTDAALTVNSNRDFLVVTPSSVTNAPSFQDSYLQFSYQTSKDTIYREFKEFYTITPLLTKALFDFQRLNNFAKILALVRWSKENNAVFLNKPENPNFVKSPIVLQVSEYSGIQLFDSVKEVKLSYGYKD